MKVNNVIISGSVGSCYPIAGGRYGFVLKTDQGHPVLIESAEKPLIKKIVVQGSICLRSVKDIDQKIRKEVVVKACKIIDVTAKTKPVNFIQLSGRIIREPKFVQVKEAKNGTGMFKFVIQPSPSFFVNIEAWDSLREKDCIQKGNFVRVIGALHSKFWPQNQKHVTFIRAKEISII